MVIFREYIVLRAGRLGRPVVFQLSRHASFDALVTSFYANLSDALREPAVSRSLYSHFYPTIHRFLFISLHAKNQVRIYPQRGPVRKKMWGPSPRKNWQPFLLITLVVHSGCPLFRYFEHAKNSLLPLWGPLFVGPLFGRTC